VGEGLGGTRGRYIEICLHFVEDEKLQREQRGFEVVGSVMIVPPGRDITRHTYEDPSSPFSSEKMISFQTSLQKCRSVSPEMRESTGSVYSDE